MTHTWILTSRAQDAGRWAENASYPSPSRENTSESAQRHPIFHCPEHELSANTRRRRVSELEQRTDELHQRITASGHPDAATLPGASWAAINDFRTNADKETRLASVAPFLRQDTIAPASFRSFSQAAAASLQTPESLPQDLQLAGTLSRSLEGQSIDPKDIDALFML